MHSTSRVLRFKAHAPYVSNDLNPKSWITFQIKYAGIEILCFSVLDSISYVVEEANNTVL